jgi:glycosyltransferase involved in cell wall biosynthesis
MKILVVQESDWLKRGPHQQHQLCDRLSARGHQIRVIDYEIDWGKKYGLWQGRQIFSDVSKVVSETKIMVIRPGFIKLPLLNYMSLFFTHDAEIERQIHEFKPDVIVGFGIINTYLAMCQAKHYRIPFVYYWIDVLHRLIPIKAMQWLGILFESVTLQHSDYVLTINKMLKERVIELGANPRKTSVICGGVDTNIFRVSISREEMRKRLNIKESDLLLLHVGWLYPFSGLDEVMEDVGGDVKLLIIGDGDAYRDLLIKRSELHKENSVIMLGRKLYKEIPNYINMADICILPADVNEKIMQDIVPVKLYEYMYMQKPVICSALPGVMKEFGTKGESGIMYILSAGNVVPFAKIMRDNKVLEGLGDMGYEVVKDYDWNKLTDKFEHTLMTLIRAKKETEIVKHVCKPIKRSK